jgi:colanic acid biosynthesis glycosyl transferase WcaI
MMRVLILAQYFPPDMGGGATRAYNVAKGLLKTGCRVTVVSGVPHYPTGKVPNDYRWKPLSVEFEGKLKIIRTIVPPLPSEGFAKRILLFASFVISSLFALPFTEKVDVVWAANPNIIAVLPSMIYKVANRCKVVQNIDDLWPEALYDLGLERTSLLARFGEFTAKIVYKLASAITPISPAYVNILSDKYGVDSRKVFVVPSGVDPDKFSYELGRAKNSGKFTVLYIGAFSPAYDFDQVLSAARSLASFSDVDFVVQGGGELAHELKRKMKEYGLKNVEIIDKIVSREEVAEIMADANALLLPLKGVGSIEMGISSKLYEYQAAGKPILCCSSGQPGRYVLQSKCGFVVKPGDSEALAKSVIDLRGRPSLARVMGENGRKYVEREASIDSIGLKMKGLFEALIKEDRCRC